eukprot:10374216-Heterocapsa_arctica.AAC.1
MGTPGGDASRRTAVGMGNHALPQALAAHPQRLPASAGRANCAPIRRGIHGLAQGAAGQWGHAPRPTGTATGRKLDRPNH